ncbi:MAG: Rrf2 family transcriptional regulator [Epsilonproteobacteria bacterium]|nr:Rrf2 family transcriptional regulator [Campylobacterota bacterium]
MALLTKKSIYGLMAIYELYKHKNAKQPIQLKDISDNTDIPKNYLEQILAELKKANFINSTRGAKGGYKFADNLQEPLIKDIIIVLDGQLHISKEKTTNPIFNLFFEDCDKKLIQMFEKPLSHMETYEQILSNQINYTI